MESNAVVRKILVAVDGGEESMYALSWCLNNLLTKSSPQNALILLYAKPPQSIAPALDGTGFLFSSDVIASMEKYSNDLAESVMDKCRAACKDLADTVKVETMVDHGDPREVICDVSEKRKPDLLVVGSHGYGFVKRAFLGSVSNHVAQNAKCPVLIVKKPKH
ncbi:hypothetical protein ACLOJK_017663 [Asimina triloba]